MNSHLRTCTLKAMAILGLYGAASLQAQQPTGQWDFDNGNLNATVGQPLQYLGATAQGTQFGTTTSFGIPGIGGAPAQVMQFPSNAVGMGFSMPTPGAANGGGSLVNDWTIIMDILFPAQSDRKWRALLDVDGGLISPDAEFFVSNGNQLGIGSYFGNIQSNTWYRIGIVVQADVDQIHFYIDGVQVGSRNAGGAAALDGRWALTPAGTAGLFVDDDGGTASGFVNSIQLRDVALSKAQLTALGGPQAAGIPQTLPAIPSFIEKWIPDAGYARANDDVGVIIDKGDSTITGITLKLDGQTTSPTITPSGSLISVILSAPGLPPRTDHTVALSFNDSAAGVKNFTNAFRVPTLYEDFEKLVLGSSVDPALGGEPNTETNVWTQTPPPGWTIDNSKMPPQSDPASGRPEWEGWSFADWKWWWSEVDDQNRSLFLKARGAIAIADDDEWDDFGGPVRNRGYFNSFLSTPSVSLAGIAPNTLTLKFDSSWRPEGFDDAGPDGQSTNNQTATIKVSYNGGAPINVLHWDSNPSGPFFHPDSENETVFLQLNNLASATNIVITFGLTLGGNDWWWAFDNLVVDAGGILAPSITKQPQSQFVYSGADMTLSVAAVGSEPLSYQWLLNGANIAGATKTNYTKLNIQAADAGDYTAIVGNPGGAVTSAVARVEIFAGSIAQGLVAHLKFDNNLTDSSGRGNNGTAVGSPTFVPGKVGADAVHIPSGADYVSLGAPSDLNFGISTDFSIAFWSRLSDWSGDPSFIGNKDWNGGANPGYVIATDDDAHLQWNYAGPPGGRKDYDGPPGKLTNGWHHVVMTFDRNVNAITYLDGVQVNATDIAANQNNVDTPAGFATNIGQDGTGGYGSAFADMDMDDLGIWRRILTPQEVASIYAQGQQGLDLGTATGAKAPVIASQPQSVTVSPGANVSLSVSATGSEPISYQWKLNAIDVGGAAGPSLNLNNIQTTSTGDYTVVLNNAAGAVTSAVARVDVFAGPVTQDLVAHLKFDNNLTDSSGRGNNGAAVGTPTFGAGKVGANAVHIPSGTDYVTLGTAADLNFGTNTDFSVAFWAKVVAWSGDPSFIANKDWDSGSNPGWVIATDSDGRIQWNAAGKPDGSTGDRKDYDSPGGVFTNGDWHHIVLTYDRSGNAVTYVDGVLFAHRDGRQVIPVAAPPNNLDTPVGKATNIGEDGTGAYASGAFTDASIDDLGIWRRVVTPQEVAAIYNAGLAGNHLETAVVGPPGLGRLNGALVGSNLNFTWSGGAGIRLQKATTLSPPNWADVSGTVGSSQATETIGAGNAFYRLLKP